MKLVDAPSPEIDIVVLDDNSLQKISGKDYPVQDPHAEKVGKADERYKRLVDIFNPLKNVINLKLKDISKGDEPHKKVLIYLINRYMSYYDDTVIGKLTGAFITGENLIKKNKERLKTNKRFERIAKTVSGFFNQITKTVRNAIIKSNKAIENEKELQKKAEYIRSERARNAAIAAATAAAEAAAAKIQQETIRTKASGIRAKLTSIFQKLSKSESSDISSLSLDTFIQDLKKNPNKDYAKMYNFTKEGANAVVDELKAIGVNVSELTGVVMMGGGNGASKTDGATAETEENIELSPEIVILLLAISNINQKFEISSDIQDYYIETIKTLYKINDIMETINTGNLKSIKKTAEVPQQQKKQQQNWR